MPGGHFERGQILFQQRRYAQAAASYRDDIAERPDKPAAMAMLALCLARTGDLNGAEEACRTSLRIQPEYAFGFSALAEILSRKGFPTLAIHAVKSGLELTPNDPGMRHQLATLHFHNNRRTEALQQAEMGLMIDPTHNPCAILRAKCLRQDRRLPEAKDLLHSVLQRDPENAVAHLEMGCIAHDQADYPTADLHFRNAIRLAPNEEKARLGILDVMRTRHFGYRMILMYGKILKRSMPFLIGIPVFLSVTFAIMNVAKPRTEHFDLGAAWAYSFVIGFWAILPYMTLVLLGVPLCNLAVRLDKVGRKYFTRSEETASNLAGIHFGAAVLLLASAVITHGSHHAFGSLLACSVACLVSAASQIPSNQRPAAYVDLGLTLVVFVPFAYFAYSSNHAPGWYFLLLLIWLYLSCLWIRGGLKRLLFDRPFDD